MRAILLTALCSVLLLLAACGGKDNSWPLSTASETPENPAPGPTGSSGEPPADTGGDSAPGDDPGGSPPVSGGDPDSTPPLPPAGDAPPPLGLGLQRIHLRIGGQAGLQGGDGLPVEREVQGCIRRLPVGL